MTLTVSPIPSVGVAPSAPPAPVVHVLLDRCAGCQECIVRCPSEALSLDPVTWTAVADNALCVGCRQCVRTCPFAAITVEGPVLVGGRVELATVHPHELAYDRAETRRPIASWQAALTEARRCLDCPDPTCVRGCPAHNDIPGFIRAIRDGDLDEAHQVLRRTSVLPDICSRVCDQAVQCEGACSWSLAGGVPVAIGALERFVTDNAPFPAIVSGTSGQPGAPAGAPAGAPGNALAVAIVGSGPAAIGAATELVASGARVSVFERAEAPGGLCRWGIPDFTLPEAYARRPWRDLVAAGVELRTDHDVDIAELERLQADYDAVVVATGAAVPLRLPITGGDLAGVLDASEFLQAAHAAIAARTPLAELAPRVVPGGAPGDTRPASVLVLGAGNTAMDVARSARRLGATASCVDWMDRRFAPVRPDELDEATAEGVVVRFLTTLRGLEGVDGHVASARLASTRQRTAHDRPEILPGPGTVEPVDLVVLAMGYRIAPEIAAFGQGVPVGKVSSGLADRRWQASGILANPAPTFARHLPVGRLALGRERARVAASLPRRDRTWFAGDALTGPSTVVEAMAQGKAVAQSICHHQPRRPGRVSPALRRVLVVTESRGGTTTALGSALAARLAEGGAQVRAVGVAQAGPEALAWADALVIGTWVEGAVLTRVGPARAMAAWLADLPPLPQMPVAIFCSYAVSAKGTLPRMRGLLEERGARVVGEQAFRRSGRAEQVAALAGSFAAALEPR